MSLVTIEWPKPDVTKLPTDEHPPASPEPEGWSGNGPPFDDDDDHEAPKVNLGPGRRTASVSSTCYDEGRQGLSPSFADDDDAHSFNSAWTTSTNAKKNNVSRGTAASRQPPDARSVAASVRSAASSSAWSGTPISAQSSVSGQRKSGWDTRSAASSRSTALSIRNEQARGDEVASVSSAQRQRSGKPQSPSVHTATSSVISGRPTGNYAASVSQSSSAASKRAPERDSGSSPTLQNTPPSTRGKRSTGSDQSSKAQSIADWCQKTSVARSSTGARTPVSSRSATPTDGRSVARSSTSARTAVSSRSSAPTEGGFPTFENTEWGDPITASQDRPRPSSRRSNSKKKKEGETESAVSMSAETETKASESAHNAGSGKKYRGSAKRRGGKARLIAKKADTPQEDSVSVMLDVKLPPGGPGSTFGDPEVEW